MKLVAAASLVIGLATGVAPALAAGPGVVIFEATGDEQLLPQTQFIAAPKGQYIFSVAASEAVLISLGYQYERHESWFIRSDGGVVTDCGGDDQGRGDGASTFGKTLGLQFVIPKGRTELNLDGDCPFGYREAPYTHVSYRDLRWNLGISPLTHGQEFTYSITVQRVAAPVPEPSTWALLIGGFGVAGASLRRRAARAWRPPPAPTSRRSPL